MTQETDSRSAICQTCGKKKAGGSITQWIFNVDNCSCLTPQKEQAVLKLCPVCGLRQHAHSGSITQWIFQSAQCKCDAQHDPLVEQQIPEDDIIAGSPYEFIGVAGTGGVGTVYKAKSKKLAKTVAIKAINPLLNEVFDNQRFEREAKSISKMLHPNILSIIDFGSMTDGRPYLVTEWIEGCTLAQYIERYGVLSVQAAEEVFCAVLDGLSHAHAKHIIHRDIKPGNIMLARTGSGWVVKIIDFGTSKDIANDQSTTRIEDLAFSPYYASPERISGTTVDHRADLYSLGCTMYETLTGRPPFTGLAMMVAMRHQSEPAPKLTDTSKGVDFPLYLEQIVARLLQKDPQRRFQTAQEVKQAVRARKADVAVNKKWFTPSLVWASTACAFFGFMYLAFLAPSDFFVDKEKSKPQTARLDQPDNRNSPAQTTPDDQYFDFKQVEVGKIENGWMDFPWEGILWKDSIGFKSADAIRRILDTPAFAFINLRQFRLTPGDLRKLCAHRNLRGLSIPDTGLTPELLDILVTVPQLEALYIGQNPALTDDDIAKLTNLKKLSTLSLSHGNFSDKCLESIAKLPALRFLHLDRMIKITGSGLGVLKNVKDLEKLSLQDTKLSEAGWRELSSLKQVKFLSVSSSGLTDKTIDYVAQLPLERLDISKCQITDRGLNALMKMTTLKWLYTSKCPLSAASIENLKKSLNCEVYTHDDIHTVTGDRIFLP